MCSLIIDRCISVTGKIETFGESRWCVNGCFRSCLLNLFPVMKQMVYISRIVSVRDHSKLRQRAFRSQLTSFIVLIQLLASIVAPFELFSSRTIRSLWKVGLLCCIFHATCRDFP